jgi:hypothetical protein
MLELPCLSFINPSTTPTHQWLTYDSASLATKLASETEICKRDDGQGFQRVQRSTVRRLLTCARCLR